MTSTDIVFNESSREFEGFARSDMQIPNVLHVFVQRNIGMDNAIVDTCSTHRKTKYILQTMFMSMFPKHSFLGSYIEPNSPATAIQIDLVV